MRKPSKFRKVTCLCGREFETNHSMGKYCSPKCQRNGERKSWQKYGEKNSSKRKKYHKVWYEQNKEIRTEQIKKYQNSPAGKLSRKKSYANMLIKYPEKIQARAEVGKALKKGLLIKKPCEVCDNPKSEAHHKDYSKPLEVEWLCRPHHKMADRKLKNELPKTA